ncbi:unnamed protein product [Rotaria sordida]|uniref:NAD(P)(+)--arginine ADP-ribosyltransferase n=1 Tax=Rotaria sordida TaxID=392033 RepID=A0A815TKL6_9BILA|nr:unnamed protein product [Rotaria sordida]
MIEDSEETIPLNLSVSNTQIHNEIENYFDLKNNIKAVHRIGPDGEVALHLITSYESTESGLLLLTNRTLESLRDISYQSSSWDEIKKLLEEHSNLFSSHEEIQEYDYIEWSSIGIDLIQKRKEFREQIDLYKTYDNQHHLLTKLLIDIIEYYLKEYLVLQEHFSKDVTSKLEFCFRKAIEEQNYLLYFIKAYTSTNNFYHVLNKHLALYILDYFDISSYSSSPTRYRLINCLVHIVTLLINHPDLHKYQYKGVSYRGLLMREDDVRDYSIGKHILNRSFVSTSKNCTVAEVFAGSSQLTSTKVSVLFKYTIKLNQTAIDIEHLSTIPDEEEVLVLPFSVFKIKNRIENCSNMCSPILIEIDLEECEDEEQINNGKQKSR